MQTGTIIAEKEQYGDARKKNLKVILYDAAPLADLAFIRTPGRRFIVRKMFILAHNLESSTINLGSGRG